MPLLLDAFQMYSCIRLYQAMKLIAVRSAIFLMLLGSVSLNAQAEELRCSEWLNARSNNDPSWVLMFAWVVAHYTGSTDRVMSPQNEHIKAELDQLCIRSPEGMLEISLGEIHLK